jgi:hypothetical protein
MVLQPFVGPWPLFSFLILYTVGRTPWRGDQPVARPLPTHRTTQTQDKRTQTSMPRVGFEPTTPVFEPARTVYSVDRAAIVICDPAIRRCIFTCTNCVIEQLMVVVMLQAYIRDTGCAKVLMVFLCPSS